LAAAAACTGQPALAMIQQRFQSANRQVLVLLRFIASMDALPALVLFGIVMSLFSNTTGMLSNFGGIPRLVMCLSLAALVSLILLSLSWTRISQPDLVLISIGLCAVLGGIASQLGVSVLFTSMTAGIIIGNLSFLRMGMAELLGKGEKLIYFVLLVLAGASWRMSPNWVALVPALAGVYVASRLLGKVIGTYAATRRLSRHVQVPRSLGLGLTAQAGMALAIVIDFRLGAASNLADVVLTVAILGIMISELVGPALAVFVVGGRDEKSEEAA
jgi:hypothetical protein